MTAPLPRRRLRRGTATTAAAAALLVAVAACGSSTGAGGASSTSKLAPLDAVKTGAEALANSHALTFTFKVDTTAAQIASISHAEGDQPGDTGDALVEKVLPGGSIVLETISAGKTFSADSGNLGASLAGSVSLDVNAGNQPDLVQLDYLDKQIYARADVSSLASYAGTAAHAEIQSFASSEGATFPFILKAVNGGWLHVDGNAAYQFIKTADPSAIPTVSPDAGSKLISGLEAQLGKDVTAKRDAADPDLGDHIVVTGNVRTVGSDLVKAFASAESSVPGASKLFADVDPSSLPDKDVSFDVYVNDGAIDAVKFDVSQVLSGQDKASLGGKPFDLELDVSRTASISAPSNPTTITTSQIVQLFESLGGAGGSDGTGSATPGA
jgi:hypothetical protein